MRWEILTCEVRLRGTAPPPTALGDSDTNHDHIGSLRGRHRGSDPSRVVVDDANTRCECGAPTLDVVVERGDGLERRNDAVKVP